MGYTLTDQWLAVLPEHPDLDKDVAHALNEVGDLWSDYWRKQHKGPLASRLRIEIVPDAKVTRTKEALTLSVKITNHSRRKSRRVWRMNGTAASGPRPTCTHRRRTCKPNRPSLSSRFT